MDIDIIVVNYKTHGDLQKFINTFDLYKTTVPFTFTVMDNESNAVPPYMDIPDWVDYFCIPENVGYAKAANEAAAKGTSKYIGIFNADVSFDNDQCIDACVEFMENNPDVGVVGPLQKNRAGKITHAGIVGPGDRPQHRAWQQVDNGVDYREAMEVLTVIGAVLFIRREAWEAVMADPIFRKHWPEAQGAMPEHFLYYEETALCYMMPRFGYKVYYLGSASCQHEWHQSIGVYGDRDAFKESQVLFRAMMDDMEIIHD